MAERYTGKLSTDAFGVLADEAKVAHLHFDAGAAAPADDDGITDGASLSSSASTSVVPDDGKMMPSARLVKVTLAGTSASIAAKAATVYGKNIAGEPISETLEAFIVDTAGSKTTTKAFAEIEKVTIDKMDGAGVTMDVGWTEAFGLPYALDASPLTFAQLDGTLETTTPTLTKDAADVAKNTATLSSALASNKAVDIFFVL